MTSMTCPTPASSVPVPGHLLPAPHPLFSLSFLLSPFHLPSPPIIHLSPQSLFYSTHPSCLLSFLVSTLLSQACRYQMTRPRPPQRRRSRRTQRRPTGAPHLNLKVYGTSKILVSHSHQPSPPSQLITSRGTKDRNYPPHRKPEDWMVR